MSRIPYNTEATADNTFIGFDQKTGQFRSTVSDQVKTHILKDLQPKLPGTKFHATTHEEKIKYTHPDDPAKSITLSHRFIKRGGGLVYAITHSSDHLIDPDSR